MHSSRLRGGLRLSFWEEPRKMSWRSCRPKLSKTTSVSCQWVRPMPILLLKGPSLLLMCWDQGQAKTLFKTLSFTAKCATTPSLSIHWCPDCPLKIPKALNSQGSSSDWLRFYSWLKLSKSHLMNSSFSSRSSHTELYYFARCSHSCSWWKPRC